MEPYARAVLAGLVLLWWLIASHCYTSLVNYRQETDNGKERKQDR